MIIMVFHADGIAIDAAIELWIFGQECIKEFQHPN